MASEHTKTKKELLVELEHARRRCAELEACLAGCESKEQTPTRRTEETLQEPHRLLEAIGGSLQAHLFVKDTQGRYLFANPTFLEAFGLSPEQVIGHTDHDLFPVELAGTLRVNDQRIMASARSETVEESGVLPVDGQLHYLLSNKIPLRSDSGDAIGILGISMDITGRKQTEFELRKLSRAVEQANAAILVTDREARIEFVNPAFTEITGFTAEEVLGKNPRLLKSGFHTQEFYKEMWSTLSEGGTWAREVLNKKKNGALFWQYASIAPVKDERGATSHFVSVQEDITDLKRSQEMLQGALTEFETIFENSAAGIIQLKGGRSVHRINSRFTEILGYASEDIVGKNTRMLHLSEESYSAFGEKQYPALIAGETVHVEQEVHHKDGSNVWCDVHGKALFPPDLEKGIIFVIMDISARKELEQLRGDVERIMRHDLKTPLNGIIGLPQIMMQEGDLSQSHVENLKLIQATGQQMLDQIDLSLELFKMETGAYGFIPTTVDLTLILRKLEKDLDMQAKEKSVEFEIPADGMPLSQSRPVKALGDELLCYSMLANILKNAMEASPPGERVTVRIQECDGEIAVSIHNKGEVPKGMRDRFFDKYTTSGKTKGTGLGTYSARLMARTQSGTIRLDSSKQDETTVVITLPASN